MAQSCILAIVFWAAMQGGPRLRTANVDQGFLQAALLVWGCVIALHAMGLVVAWYGGRMWGFDRSDRVATTFAGSQKTLPIGIYIATDLLQGVPFAVYPMVMFHASQLVLDTFVIDLMQRPSHDGQRESDPSVR